MLLALTGAVIWWPGIDTWRRSLSFRWKANPKGFNWTLHSALGFWTFAFFFMWAITGIYLSIPTTFNAVVDFLEPLKESSRSLRFGDKVLFWFAQAHFGRFAGIPVKIVWTVIGLAPAALFVTGIAHVVEASAQAMAGKKRVCLAADCRGRDAAGSENSVHARPSSHRCKNRPLSIFSVPSVFSVLKDFTVCASRKNSKAF